MIITTLNTESNDLRMIILEKVKFLKGFQFKSLKKWRSVAYTVNNVPTPIRRVTDVTIAAEFIMMSH